MMRIIGLGLAGLTTFVAVFLLALHVHFPSDAARDRIAWEVQQASKGEWLIQASDARLYRLMGLALEDVVLLQAEKGPRRSTDEGPPATAVPVLRLSELAVRAQPLALLRGERSAAFHAELYGGRLDGAAGVSETAQRLRLEGRDIDLARIPFEGEDWSVEATGKLAIDSDLTLDTSDIKASTGHFDLRVADLVFQSASVMGMTLEPTPFTEAVLAFEVDDGKAKVEQGHFESEPVDIKVDGEIVLNKDLLRSRLKLDLEIRFGAEFDRFAQMAPNLKSARDDDGVYHFRVTGTLDNPRFREQRQTRRTSRATSAKRLDGDDEGPDVAIDEVGSGDEDADARRDARRDRIRERRQKMLDRRKNRGEGGLPDELPPDAGPPPADRLPPKDRFDEEEFFEPDEDMDVQDMDFPGPDVDMMAPDDMDMGPPDDQFDEQY